MKPFTFRLYPQGELQKSTQCEDLKFKFNLRFLNLVAQWKIFIELIFLSSHLYILSLHLYEVCKLNLCFDTKSNVTYKMFSFSKFGKINQ